MSSGRVGPEFEKLNKLSDFLVTVESLPAVANHDRVDWKVGEQATPELVSVFWESECGWHTV